MAFSTEEILALHALRDGVLRLEQGAWWIVADDHAREVSARLVQGLRGQGLLAGVLDADTDRHEFHLTDRGRRVAENAFAGLAARGAADERAARALLRHGPLALLRPAADSEEVDYLLAIRVDAIEAQRHRTRMMRARGGRGRSRRVRVRAVPQRGGGAADLARVGVPRLRSARRTFLPGAPRRPLARRDRHAGRARLPRPRSGLRTRSGAVVRRLRRGRPAHHHAEGPARRGRA